MKNFNTFVWSSDFEDFTGEGLLARCFVENCFLYNAKAKILSNGSEFFYFKKKITKTKPKIYYNNFFTKYLLFFYGIILIWNFHLKGKKTFYINYLPLWNFFIFFFLPSATILGPITGNIYKNRIYSFNSFIRKVIFPIFYYISIKIIFKKYKTLIFSTENLEKIIPSYLKNKCIFNFCLLSYKKRKLIKKNINFVFYFRKHPSKTNDFHEFLIKKLADSGRKVIVVGDEFLYKNVVNYINVPREHLLSLLDRASYAVSAGDNFYSLFLLDCISCNVKLFFNKDLKPKNFQFSNMTLIPLNFKNFDAAFKRILFTTNKTFYEHKKKIIDNDIFSMQNKIKLEISKFIF